MEVIGETASAPHPRVGLRVRRILLLLALALGAGQGAAVAEHRGTVDLEPCPIPESDETMLCGAFEVPENRKTGRGRKVALRIAVVPARRKPRPDPIFFIAGGPGDTAIRYATEFSTSRLRDNREVVLVDQRGAGGSNPLLCDLPGGPSDLQGYLETYFGRLGVFRRCRKQLKKVANLRLYSTPVAMDDLDDVRAAMGYEQINLYGRSYGTRAALVYLRRHPARARTALLSGLAPLAYTSPLYHAASAQQGIELLAQDCALDPGCRGAFPDFLSEFDAVLETLAEGPVPVEIEHPVTGEPVTVDFPYTWFAEAVRLLMYNPENARYLPYLVYLAYRGAYAPIAQYVVNRRHAMHEAGDTIGMLLSVTCPGDLARIDESAIPPLTEGTFAGDERVRQQLAVCRIWPKARMPKDYGEPVQSGVPTLLWSGTEDPVTPPRWGEEAARHLSNSLHLVVPGGHAPSGACVEKVSRKFLNRASVRGLTDRCLDRIRLPPFVLPGAG